MGFLDDLIEFFFDDDIGKYGESLTELNLQFVNLFGWKGVTLKNIYIPKGNGETSEIDLVYITQKGIFVIESKNYSGWIFGDENSQYWTQALPNKQKNHFYNPIMQNRTHIKWLKKYLGEDVFCYSMIVFSERCELKKVTTHSDNLSVIHRDELASEFWYLWRHLDDLLNQDKIEEIRQKLAVLTNADQAVKQAHVDSIHARFTRSSFAPEESPSQKKCPRCGAPLVLRTAYKGAKAGNQFYGCSAFPKCRYIGQIESNHSNSFYSEEQ